MKKLATLGLLLLSTCTTVVRETQPGVTASQQYLIAQSAINEGTKFTIAEIETHLTNNLFLIKYFYYQQNGDIT